MNLNLKGKYALITGGSRGIGREIARILIEEGCEVAVCARNKEDLEKIQNELGCLAIKADCSNNEEIKKVIEHLKDKPDILINNVGGGGSWGSEKYEDFEEWEEVYQKNAGAAIKFTMGFLPGMIKKGHGRVISIASIYGKEAGGKPWFNMAKAAEISLMKNLAGKYAGITFNTICPGHIDVGKPFPDAPKILGKPEDVAHLVVFLCSEKAKHINGACITVDGGESRSF